MFSKKVRVILLLLVLFYVASTTVARQARSTDWDNALWVVIYPINADGSAASKETIKDLRRNDFSSVEEFISREAAHYHVPLNKPVSMRLAPTVKDLPPVLPANRSRWDNIIWSLKMRYWAYSHDTFTDFSADIQIFVLYHDPKTTQGLAHSLGLQKGLLGVVNAFATEKYHESNNVVIAHEMLHTLGASDKYDYSNDQPLYPTGYANPDSDPLYPQEKSVIMAGKKPLSASKSVMPKGLRKVVISALTAQEINWVQE